MKHRTAKAYELHDAVYRELRAKNLRHWLDNGCKVPPPVKDGIDAHAYGDEVVGLLCVAAITV
jgi:hypothetical protein